MNLKKYCLIISLIFCIVLTPFIWADSNGIWHLAEDLRPGIVGNDEDDTTSQFIFLNPIVYRSQEIDERYIKDQDGDTVNGEINFLNNVTYKGDDLDARYINALESDVLTGNLGITGSITAAEHLYTSDKKLKTNISTLKNSIEKLKKLEGVNFNWKSNNKKDIGFIAQDVEIVVPELVTTNEKDGVKSVKYGNIVPILVEAIKEQQKQIENLELEISKLKNEK